MKWYQRVKYVMTQIFHRKLSLVTSVAVVTVAFLFLDLILYGIGKQYYNEIKLIQCVNKPKSTYHVTFLDMNRNDENTEKMKAVIADIQKKAGISGGKFYTYSLRFEELQNEEYYKVNHTEWPFELDPEQERIMEEANVDGLQDMIFIDSGLVSMCRIRLADGRTAEDAIKEYEGRNPVLVGYDYRNLVAQGDTLTEDRTKQQYVVAGILAEDSEWVSYNDISPDYAPLSLNHLFLTCAREKVVKRVDDGTEIVWRDEMETESAYGNSVYFVADSALSSTEVTQWIASLESKHDFPLECGTVADILQDSITENVRQMQLFIISAVIALIVTALSICMASITSLLIRTKEYAVMIANGFLLSDLAGMVLMENIVKIGIPLVVSYQIMTVRWDKPVIAHLCLGISALYGIFLIILCTMASVSCLKRMNMSETLGGNAND